MIRTVQRIGITGMAVAVLCAWGGAGIAGAQTTTNQPAAEKNLHPGLARASKLEGEDVYDTNGHKVGDIKDFLLDPRADRVLFAVMATTNDVGLNKNYVAIPWKDFGFNRGQDSLVLHLDLARLKRAPNFESSQWPDVNDRTFWGKTARFYGEPLRGNAQLVRASDFLKMNVRNAQNETLGSIQDLVFDMQTDRIRYAVLDAGGFLGIGGKYFAIPMTAFQVPPSRADKTLVLAADKNRLTQAPGFDKDHWPDLASTQWERQSDRYWSSPPAAKKQG